MERRHGVPSVARSYENLFLLAPALGRKPEEVVTSYLVASSFPADVGEGGVNLTIPFVASVEYPYLGRQVHPNATCLSLNHVINLPQ